VEEICAGGKPCLGIEAFLSIGSLVNLCRTTLKGMKRDMTANGGEDDMSWIKGFESQWFANFECYKGDSAIYIRMMVDKVSL